MCGSAQAAESSVVGYNTINLEAGKWYMVIPQFAKTGVAEGDTFNALDVMSFSGLNAGTFATKDNTAPMIQVHRPSDNGYTIYYYISDAKKIVGGMPQDVTAWTDAMLASESISVGKFKGFWFKAVGVTEGATLTVAGEVRDLTNPIDVPVGQDGQWQMIGNPYPCDLNVENFAVVGLPAGTFATKDTTAPMIQVHRPSDNGYTIYYYISDAKKIVGGMPQDVTAWTDAMLATTGKICDAGKGFWLKVPSGTSGKLVFSMTPSEK